MFRNYFKDEEIINFRGWNNLMGGLNEEIQFTMFLQIPGGSHNHHGHRTNMAAPLVSYVLPSVHKETFVVVAL